jgi:hypothetical protein
MTPSSRPVLVILVSLLAATPAAAQGLFEDAVNESKAGGDKQDKPDDAAAADKGGGDTGLSGSLGGLHTLRSLMYTRVQAALTQKLYYGVNISG